MVGKGLRFNEVTRWARERERERVDKTSDFLSVCVFVSSCKDLNLSWLGSSRSQERESGNKNLSCNRIFSFLEIETWWRSPEAAGGSRSAESFTAGLMTTTSSTSAFIAPEFAPVVVPRCKAATIIRTFPICGRLNLPLACLNVTRANSNVFYRVQSSQDYHRCTIVSQTSWLLNTE